MRSDEQMERSKTVFKEAQSKRPAQVHYEKTKICPKCGTKMKYVYGEMFECPSCGNAELSDFGKVREYLEKNGPQPAVTIADATGVSIEMINELLRQGRVEIPDGSSIYIHCQACGADIRYGRYCPECMMKLTKNLNGAMSMMEVGEKPKHKTGNEGRMHILDSPQLHNRR